MRNSKKIQNVLIATLIALVSFSACSHDEKEKLIVTRQDSTSYSLGVTFAKKIPQNLKDNNFNAIVIDIKDENGQ